MIRALPREISDKIAAGEVVERPVSIVKELIENAVDAGSTSITCEIRKGGKDYIRVTDNGCGIPADEVELAFMRYATSKIATEDDLNAIGTLGFRGEALASIAAVSRVELVTKPKDAKSGTRIRLEGGIAEEITEAACEDGTTIIVTDLFYNTPARRKFLKPDNAEASLISDYVSKMALAYPGVRFRLISNGTILYSTLGKGDLKAAIRACGLEPKTEPFRGGTDGSALSHRGLPAPNLSAGYENAHGRFEYVPVQSMEKNVEILLELVRICAGIQ